MIIQIKNAMYRFKKESRIRAKLSISSMRKSTATLDKTDRSTFLLQSNTRNLKKLYNNKKILDLKTDDENNIDSKNKSSDF
jgi:hypothetical protein